MEQKFIFSKIKYYKQNTQMCFLQLSKQEIKECEIFITNVGKNNLGSSHICV